MRKTLKIIGIVVGVVLILMGVLDYISTSKIEGNCTYEVEGKRSSYSEAYTGDYSTEYNVTWSYTYKGNTYTYEEKNVTELYKTKQLLINPDNPRECVAKDSDKTETLIMCVIGAVTLAGSIMNSRGLSSTNKRKLVRQGLSIARQVLNKD